MAKGKKRSKKAVVGRIALGVLILAIVVAAAVAIPIFTHQSAGGSGQKTPEGFPSSVEAHGADGRTRTLAAFDTSGEPANLESLSPGEELTVRGTGYDTDIGVYVGFCKVPADPQTKPGPCLGGIPDDAQEEKEEDIANEALESAWVTNNWAWRAFASHTFMGDGDFEVLLKVPAATSEILDCGVETCALYTRADHTALKDRVQDIYLPISFK